MPVVANHELSYYGTMQGIQKLKWVTLDKRSKRTWGWKRKKDCIVSKSGRPPAVGSRSGRLIEVVNYFLPTRGLQHNHKSVVWASP